MYTSGDAPDCHDPELLRGEPLRVGVAVRVVAVTEEGVPVSGRLFADLAVPRRAAVLQVLVLVRDLVQSPAELSHVVEAPLHNANQ